MNQRNSAKAIILANQQVLLTKNRDEEGFFYLFPGGGQHFGEALADTVQRECLEETGFSVDVGELTFVRDYIGKHHEHASFDSNVHQVEFYFLCSLTSSVTATDPKEPDNHQVGVEWVPLSTLNSIRLYPKQLIGSLLTHLQGSSAPVYLGHQLIDRGEDK
ncbi:MutT/Nudix family protein [Bacillus sp. JCM 19046]|nr:MutT/Nudix family protein [Bacillus sp. JCM 19045]GAF15819.1 MutT/Nudix family protein [Bacillus sp. JCM 19046]